MPTQIFTPQVAVTFAALLAALAPALIAFNVPPSATFFNQAAAFGAWGGFAMCAGSADADRLRHASLLLLALALPCAMALASGTLGHLPGGLVWSAAGLLLGAVVMVCAGAATAAAPLRSAGLSAFFTAWLAAGLLCVAIAVVQVFLPDLPDGDWIARSGLPGRAVGNLRQPNHLSSLLLWSAVAIVPLLERGWLRRGSALLLMAMMVFGITLSGSRTGGVGLVVLALWAGLDRRLSVTARRVLLAAPVFYGLAWLGMSVWAADTHNTFGAAARLGESDLSASRFAIWRNTLTLIAQQPWLGVGFGEFNFAWTLTPFPDRPIAFFDHTHNLPLQLAVEMGVPMALLILGLLGCALWLAWRRTRAVVGPEGSGMRAAFVMVLLMGLHSQLEYPLWYAYFLLPTAWAWGLCLGAETPASDRDAPRSIVHRWLPAAGLAMIIASVVAVADYRRVAAIFSAEADAVPLAQRIAVGQRSWLFGHHADYAAATTAEHPSADAGALQRAPHYLLDTRLMIAWARADAEQGDLDRARHLAQRLREFRNPQAAEFFAECNDPARLPRPFQCDAPSRALGWRDFLR